MSIITAVVIFFLAYLIIISEKIHRTKIALLGACLLIFFKVFKFEKAIHYIDFNTIFLLIGMMTLVNIIKETGLFEYLSIKLVKFVKGEPLKIMIALSLLTAISSAFLDNVTTVLLISPITILITQTLNKNPTPFLIAQIFTSNIGGTATLIGDPPNIVIGGATQLSFIDFLIYLGPISLISLIVIIFILAFIYRKDWGYYKDTEMILNEMDEKKAIKDKVLLIKSVIILLLTILAFFLHSLLNVEAGIIALTGGVLLSIIGKIDINNVLEKVEWPIIFFFIGLFILVGGLEEVGILGKIAKFTTSATNNVIILTLIILVISAIFSSIIDNIPFVVAMIPILKEISHSLYPSLSGLSLLHSSMPLWWALAIGACFGGNGTLIGASANLVVSGLSEKTREPINFWNYIKVGFPIMIITIIISIIYLYIRFFI